MVKAAYAKKRKEAERNNDEATAAQVGYGALHIKPKKNRFIDILIHKFESVCRKWESILTLGDLVICECFPAWEGIWQTYDGTIE